MTDVLREVWAKSPAAGQTAGETLAVHTAHVLARLAGWRDRYPALPSHSSRGDLWNLSAWACLLHDLGKAAPGFQQMLRGGPSFPHRHEVLSLVAVGCLDLDEEGRALIAAGVATHHRDLREIRESYHDRRSRSELLAGVEGDVLTAWQRWLAGEGRPDVEKLGFAAPPALRPVAMDQALLGTLRSLEALHESLEGQDATCPQALAARAMRGLVTLADHCGSAHARLANAPQIDSPDAFAKAAGMAIGELFPHQLACNAADGHAILTAPTGSGKTEAALLWAARQRVRGPGAPTLFYVLPYRASLNAMYWRMRSQYGLAEGAVTLQHSGATTALYASLLAKSYEPVRAAAVARRERSLGKLMTSSVRVLTPYQLLRGLFGLRGHEAILTDAAGGLFVLDELHAYDIPRLGIILAGIEHLARDLGARVLAMSATFPTVLREILGDTLGLPHIRVDADATTQELFRRHTLRLVDRDLADDGTVADITARAQTGEAVLVVATTVARAQALFDRLRPVGEELGADTVSLLHGRFTGDDRGRKEEALARRVGTRHRRFGGAGTVLVATQVVEVSLDVDFDVLYTDPAPIEALLQRFGRVNRARRGGLRDVVVHTAIPSPGVYETALVQRAIDILRPAAGQPIVEAATQQWVDDAYEPIAAQWVAAVRHRIAEVRDAVIRTNRPLDTHDELKDRFDELFDGAEVVPKRFEAEYRRRLSEDPMLATGLRVPLSNGQRWRLARAGLLKDEIADIPYDAERGLDLRAPDHGA